MGTDSPSVEAQTHNSDLLCCPRSGSCASPSYRLSVYFHICCGCSRLLCKVAFTYRTATSTLHLYVAELSLHLFSQPPAAVAFLTCNHLHFISFLGPHVTPCSVSLCELLQIPTIPLCQIVSHVSLGVAFQ